MKKQQIYFHIDVNSAFLSWSSLLHRGESGYPDRIQEIPAAIGGNEENRHGIVLAKSIAAKRFGVQTGEPLARAREKCPELLVFPPDYDQYVKCSRKLMKLLSEYSPTVEQYSIDEAFVDMTGMEKLFGEPLDCAQKIRVRIREELGFTVNVGISVNRLLAKMASDFEKPDKVHTLFPDEIPRKMWPLPVRELFGVGGSTEKKLEKLGIHTIGDLAKSDRDYLARNLKSQGKVLWDYANGIESSPMVGREVENKGYGNSVTLPRDLLTVEDARLVILSLCETVGARLRMDQMKGSVVTVQLVDSSFWRRSHQEQLGRMTDSTNEIYAAACRLLREMWNNHPIRLIGVQVSKAAKEEYHQLSLFGEEENEKQRKLDAAIDKIRGKYGEDAIKRTSFLDSPYSHMSKGLNQAKRKNRGTECEK